jgi:hypothetical protein
MALCPTFHISWSVWEKFGVGDLCIIPLTICQFPEKSVQWEPLRKVVNKLLYIIKKQTLWGPDLGEILYKWSAHVAVMLVAWKSTSLNKYFLQLRQNFIFHCLHTHTHTHTYTHPCRLSSFQRYMSVLPHLVFMPWWGSEYRLFITDFAVAWVKYCIINLLQDITITLILQCSLF